MVQEHIKSFQGGKNVLEHIKFSRRLGCNKNTYEFSNFPGKDNTLIRRHQLSRRIKYYKNHINFLGEANILEHIKISRRVFSKFCKNTCDFPRDHTPKNRYFAKLPLITVGCFRITRVFKLSCIYFLIFQQIIMLNREE